MSYYNSSAYKYKRNYNPNSVADRNYANRTSTYLTSNQQYGQFHSDRNRASNLEHSTRSPVLYANRNRTSRVQPQKDIYGRQYSDVRSSAQYHRTIDAKNYTNQYNRPSQPQPLRNRNSGLTFHSREVPIRQKQAMDIERSTVSTYSNQQSYNQFAQERSRRGERRQQDLFKRNDPHQELRRDTTAELKSQDTDLNKARDVGIRNTGNSCYVNSVIQLLRHCPSLTKLITKDRIIKQIKNTRESQDSFKITTLLNNAMNNLNLNNPNEAVRNIIEIRKHLSKLRIL